MAFWVDGLGLQGCYKGGYGTAAIFFFRFTVEALMKIF